MTGQARIIVEFSGPIRPATEGGGTGGGFTPQDLLQQDQRVAQAFDILGLAFGDADLSTARPAQALLRQTLRDNRLDKPIWFNGFWQFFAGGVRPAGAIPKAEHIRRAYDRALGNGVRAFTCGWLMGGSPLVRRDGTPR